MTKKITNTNSALPSYDYYIIDGSLYMLQSDFKRYVRNITNQMLSLVFINETILKIDDQEAYSIEQMTMYCKRFSQDYLKSDLLLKELTALEEAHKNEPNSELKELLSHKQAVIDSLTKEITYTKREMVHNIIKHKASVNVSVARWRALYAAYNRECSTNVGLLLTHHNKVKENKKYQSKIEFIDEKLEDIDTLLSLAVSLFERSYNDFLKHMRGLNSNEEI